jgi:DNA-binding transcriptional MerR regulator
MTGNGQIESSVTKSLYRIGEVSRLTDTKPFVLRYWETEFPMLQPVKSAKGHRLYRREDVETVRRIKRLLYDEGFTIAGARRHLRETGGLPDAAEEGATAPECAAEAPTTIGRKVLLDLRDSLRAFLTLLENE